MKLVAFAVEKGIESHSTDAAQESQPKWVFVANSWLAESMHTSHWCPPNSKRQHSACHSWMVDVSHRRDNWMLDGR